jgi:guanylate kinase
VVISGPSASGKTSIIRELRLLQGVHFSVSATTRPPRPGETDGVDYWFYSDQRFMESVRAEGFLEYATVHGKLYGTPLAPVTKAIAQGMTVLMDIDVQGALQVKQRMPEALMIYVLPPSRSELERRLRNRGTEDETAIDRRLRIADWEVAQSPSYDFIVVNDILDEAVEDMKAILRAHSLRMPQGGVSDQWLSSGQKI